MTFDDLNKYTIPTGSTNYVNQEDYSITSTNSDIEIIFRNHKKRLLEIISCYPYVIGCVAWLTDLDILHAMSNMEHVSIIIQKEDFLRPDSVVGDLDWKQKLRLSYESLPSKFTRTNVDGLINILSYRGNTFLDPVRCMGNMNIENTHAFPRMHNKFLVFTHGNDSELCISEDSCVWTGSYNLSATSARSFENVVVIHDKSVSQAYFKEWNQITALSESLDWTSEWSEPEWRIGS